MSTINPYNSNLIINNNISSLNSPSTNASSSNSIFNSSVQNSTQGVNTNKTGTDFSRMSLYELNLEKFSIQKNIETYPELAVQYQAILATINNAINEQINNPPALLNETNTNQKINDAQSKLAEVQNKITLLQSQYEEVKQTYPELAAQYPGMIKKMQTEVNFYNTYISDLNKQLKTITTPKTPEEQPVNTISLLRSLVGSDTDGSKSSSKTEIKNSLKKAQGQLEMLQSFKQNFPFLAPFIDNMITQCQSSIKALSLVNNNFDAFANNPDSLTKDNVVDNSDIERIINAAKSDSNVYDFSSKDLKDLKASDLIIWDFK